MGGGGKGSEEDGIYGVGMGDDVQDSGSDGANLRVNSWVLIEAILKVMEGFH